jgi:phenylalanyl-tRNA synthetase beta chain
MGQLLTGCGLEVESITAFEAIAGGLKGLIVGEVKEASKHPNADKLSLTKVDVGGEHLLSIVCGAPNVAAGQKVIVATVGTTVHPVSGDPFEIKKSKIRGELSEGMICAEDEIGLGTSHAGILVLDNAAIIGTPAADYFGLKIEQVFEIGLTPNRADAASHIGVARDVSAVVLARQLKNDPHAEPVSINFPEVLQFSEELGKPSLTVEVKNPEACKRYSGVSITNLKVKPSPDWLQQRLQSIGIRTINNIVDITNYVLHELGHPLHAFDAAKIQGDAIIVRKAVEGEKFTTLDGVERKLSADDLMICDAHQPLCIAGVFGGQNSGVTETTTSIFLESACFDAVHVRKTSKRHGLKTDSSFRFERGTDPLITIKALERAAWLIQDIAGGKVTSAPIDYSTSVIEPVEIAFSYPNCDTLIGKVIDRNTIKKILTALSIEILSEGHDTLLLAVPPFKVDVTREADVVEEILRIYGYNNIGFPDQVKSALSYSKHPDAELLRERLAEFLTGMGFHEILNNSLTKATYTEQLNTFLPEHNVVMLNPLSSDLAILRRTLLFGGLETIAYNQNRRSHDLKLFEFGSVYSKNQPFGEQWPYHENRQLAFWLTGRRNPEAWHTTNESLGFTDLKSTIQQLLSRAGLASCKIEALVPDDLLTEGLTYSVKKFEIARIGKVVSRHLKTVDVQGEVWYGVIDWENLVRALTAAPAIRFTEVPKFPAVRRDLALVIDKQVNYRDIEQLAWQAEKNLLKEVNLFDIYEGEKLGGDKKSYAISFIFQDENATLTDKQIEKVMEKLTRTLTEKLGAVVRS